MAVGSMMTDQGVASTTRELRSRPERILIADDEHLVAAGLRANLIELGYAVVGPAADGEEAIELARTERPDLALLDIRMSKTDGIAAGKIISMQFGIPVMMISAYSDPQHVEDTNSFNVYGYLLKPITVDQLRVSIEVGWNRYLESNEQQSQIDRLTQRLENRKIIEQAKWVLVSKKGIPEPEAMRLLQQQARNNRRTLVDVANSLLESDTLLS